MLESIIIKKLKARFYCCEWHCSDINSLVSAFLKIFQLYPTSEEISDIVTLLRQLQPPLELAAKSGDWSVRSLAICLLQDLKTAIRASVPSSFVEWKAESSLRTFANKCVTQLNSFGLHAPDPRICVVDKFPPPFEAMVWEAFCPDSTDEISYGIKPGVYFREDETGPIYSEYVLAHELIHHYAGQTHTELLGRGLEDGFAELIGSLYLGYLFLGPLITKQLYRTTMLEPNLDSFWEIYVDYTRLALTALREFGLQFLMDMIGKGRKAIKELELKMLMNSNWLDSKPHAGTHLSKQESDFFSFANHTVNCHLRTMMVDPIDMIIAPLSMPGETVSSLSKLIDAPHSAVRRSFDRLQSRVFVVLHQDGEIHASDGQMLNKAGVIRYKINPNNLNRLLDFLASHPIKTTTF